MRIKRSVQAQYNTELATVLSSVETGEAPAAAKGADPMAMVEAQAKGDAPAFVSASALSRPAQDAANAEQVGGEDDDLL